MKILLINNQFSVGGAARVAAVQCNQLNSYNDVDLYVATDFINWSIDYELDDTIKLYGLNLPIQANSYYKKICKAINCVYDIRKLIKDIKPDVIIAIQADMYLRALVANIGINIPLVVADHTSFNRKQDLITDLTRYYLYKYADGISILTHKDEKLLGSKYPQKYVIYNPLSFNCINEKSIRNNTVLCVGRLDVWDLKGFDIIIKQWAIIHANHPEWFLEIAGTGTDDSITKLKELAVSYHVEDSVRFLGQVKNMVDLYRRTSIFALPSRVEGFPMALLEAMSQGCACIAFSIDGAADEMLGDDSGIVIKDGDIEHFRNQLDYLISNKLLQNIYSTKAINRAIHFNPSTFGKEWVKFINNVVNHGKS